MVYEVPQLDHTQEQYEEMKKIAERNLCAVCGAELTIHTVPERGTLAVSCSHDKEHHGYIERASYTALMRRGEAIVHPGIQAAIEKKMMPKEDLGRAMNLLALRYPRAIENPESAALFIMDCLRLDIDPLIQPAEAVPVPFKSRKGKEEKTTVAMVVTEDGWLSMCARGCKDEWNGPPRTMRLDEYLTTLPENKKLSREDIAKLAKEIKKDACKDENAWYYVAIGRSKTMTEDAVVPGWFTDRDLKKAEAGNLPAFYEPGNQARVRAIKKWVRHVYPECRKRMIEMTKEWYQRSEGVKAAQAFIDAEYSLLLAPEGEEKTGTPGTGSPGSKQQSVAQSEGRALRKEVKAPRTPNTCQCPKPLPPDEVYSKEDGSFWHVACAGYLCTPPLDCFPGCPHMPFEKETTLEKEKPKPDTPIELAGEGFHINLAWLDKTMKAINWTDLTAKTWIAANLKVNTQGKLTEVIARLNREQAERFVKELQQKAEKTQLDLWE